MKRERIRNYVWVGASIVVALLSGNAAAAQSAKPIDASKARIIEHWTPERRANAIPRDLVIDPRGLGYLRRPDGTLVPYGHNIAAQVPATNQSVSPFAKPSGGGSSGSSDTTPPDVKNMDPAGGTTIGASYTFKATVTDDSGVVKSVTFNIQKSGSTFVNSFSASNSGSNIWSLDVSGFTDGTWKWWVVAKDGAKRGGNTTTTTAVTFDVSTGSTGGGGGGTGSGDVVSSAEWTSDGTVQTAAGRLYFEMPSNTKWKGPWTGYVCSGTVATDSTTGRSIIMTASHCVYDDVNKAFARNVMFIPDQAATTGSGTDLNCNNDPLGCWVPSFGVVDVNWTTRTFPDNIAWDYAYYVVKDSGAHSVGYTTTSSDALDAAAGSLNVNFGTVQYDDSTTGKTSADYTYALGYSYDQDPKFMYCAEDMTTKGAANWWLPSCELSGGSSGGPWMQPITSGNGPIISVNSWGYTNSPGMAGPKLVGTSAQCIFNSAIAEPFPTPPPPDGKAGIAVDTCP